MKKTMLIKFASSTVAVLLATFPATGQDAQSGKSPQPKQAAVHQGGQSDAEQGQQVFTQNCSRCHKAPEAIRQSISGTVALHMRIRAGLSEQDYKRLLAFLSQ